MRLRIGMDQRGRYAGHIPRSVIEETFGVVVGFMGLVGRQIVVPGGRKTGKGVLGGCEAQE